MAGLLRRAGCVYAEDEARLIIEAAVDDEARLARLVARRCGGEPLELVVGFAEFAGRRVLVEPGVFVPRRRTAGLVDIAVDVLRSQADPGVVVDLGCGSGALLMAVLHRIDAEAYALDASGVAVRCARRNLSGTGATVLHSDYFSALPADTRGRVHVVLANLPYVPTAGLPHLPREARLYEPSSALDGGFDGLVPFRAAVADVGRWLSPTGAYLCELNEAQLGDAARIVAMHGLVLDASIDPYDAGALVSITRRV